MVMDALRGYVQLANGLTEVTRQRAQQAAKALLQQTGADALTSGLTGKVTDLADEIVATSKSNRKLLQAIVENEVEGAVARLGFVRSEEVAALTRRVEGLERELADANDALALGDCTGARCCIGRGIGTGCEEGSQEGAREEGSGPEGTCQEGCGEEGAGQEERGEEGGQEGPGEEGLT